MIKEQNKIKWLIVELWKQIKTQDTIIIKLISKLETKETR